MATNVREFARPAKTDEANGSLVLVKDVTSPFFNWQGRIVNGIVNDHKQYYQLMCAHNDFQFPVLTFAAEQLTFQ